MYLRRAFLFALDFLFITMAGVISLFVRFGWDFLSIAQFFPSVLISALVGGISLFFFGAYKTVWAYLGNDEIFLLFKAFIFGYFLNLLVDLIFPFVMPRSIGIMTFTGGLIIIVLSRIWWSWYVHRDESNKKTQNSLHKNVAIIGAGEAGITLMEDIEKYPDSRSVKLFIDDSRRKIGRKVRGISVYGPISEANRIIAENGINEVIIAIPSADSREMKKIVSYIDPKAVNIKVLPSLHEMIDKKAKSSMIRAITIEDLLGRDPVDMDMRSVKETVKGKTVLITGAGGSIGSEIMRQIIRMDPAKVIALGRGENSIYLVSAELKKMARDNHCSYVRSICDITDTKGLKTVFENHRPDLVYHCAAHKHVPLMEENPSEAIRVNAMGTKKLIDMAIRYATERFTLISTDKAVNPTSIMGVSKRLAEIYLRAVAGDSTGTKFAVVRFGNVLGSRGSVIPKFKRQIEAGGPVTVTDPRMRRFFMTIPEASSLVLQASSFMSDGDLFILDMGEQVYIRDLVENMIILAGLIPDQDIKIEFTGARPGEKLFEELYLNREKTLPTEHPKIYKVVEEERLKKDEVEDVITNMYQACLENKTDDFSQLLEQYVPDHQLKQKGGFLNATESERVQKTK